MKMIKRYIQVETRNHPHSHSVEVCDTLQWPIRKYRWFRNLRDLPFRICIAKKFADLNILCYVKNYKKETAYSVIIIILPVRKQGEIKWLTETITRKWRSQNPNPSPGIQNQQLFTLLQMEMDSSAATCDCCCVKAGVSSRCWEFRCALKCHCISQYPDK